MKKREMLMANSGILNETHRYVRITLFLRQGDILTYATISVSASTVKDLAPLPSPATLFL